MVSIDVRLISIDDDAPACFLFLQCLTVLDKIGPDASCILHIVHPPNHIRLPVAISHGGQHVLQCTRMHGDVVLFTKSVDQVGSGASASLAVVLSNALDEDARPPLSHGGYG